jgi:hypothetical protein
MDGEAMIELQQVVLLNTAHKEKIKLLASRLWDGTTYAYIIHRLLQGELILWETANSTGLVITEIISHHRGNELFIYGIAGSGILPKRKAVLADLKEMAVLNGCKFIGADASRSGWKMFNKELGFAPVSTHYVKEL